MTDVKKKSDLVANMAYEHCRAGKVLSKGHQTIDRHRRTHIIQEDEKGKKRTEIIVDPKKGETIKIDFDEKGKKISEEIINLGGE